MGMRIAMGFDRRTALRHHNPMKVTLTVDDKLMSEAAEYAGVEAKADLLRLTLRKYVEREAARRLAALGGTEPDLKPIPRRRLPATKR